jgi:hypothetical protein
MRTQLLTALLGLFLTAAAQGPEVVKVDNRISVQADNISLGFLLQLWDKATGMRSTVPPNLADRKLSVHFTNLNVTDAVQKIFEKQPLNYVVIDNRGIVVTGVETAAAPETPAYDNEPVSEEPQQVTGQPDLQQARQKPSPTAPPPVETPFGPSPTPTGFQPMLQLPPVLGAPPQPTFFGVQPLPVPPAGAPNGPTTNQLFGAPTPVYQSPALPIPAPAPEQRP